MDVSPSWWIKARKDETFLKSYIYEKFESDYYPRIIQQGREEVDLDKSGKHIKESILQILKEGNFYYEFLPEDQVIKDSYSISKGNVHYEKRKSKINSRILVKVNLKT